MSHGRRSPHDRPDGRRRVVRALTDLGVASRADLARAARLAPSTVTALVAELIETGIVVETEVPTDAEARAGRPATMLALHRAAGVVVGIDLGRSHLGVAAADLSHQVLSRRVVTVDPDWHAAESIDAARALVHDVLAAIDISTDEVVGVGMGLPGPVHSTGTLGDSTILPGWVGVRAAEAVSEALGMQVRVDNDANLGALGEWMWGAGRAASEVVFLKLSIGIGAGLVIMGQPYSGFGGTAGEIGHTVIDPSGPICRCGNRGCLEMYAGSSAVIDSLRATHTATLSIGDVIAMAQAGDSGCRRALGDAGHFIGMALASLCNVVNPQRVIVGGELGAAGPLIHAPMQQAVERGAVRSAADDLEIVSADLGDDAGLMGALALALRSGEARQRPLSR